MKRGGRRVILKWSMIYCAVMLHAFGGIVGNNIALADSFQQEITAGGNDAYELISDAVCSDWSWNSRTVANAGEMTLDSSPLYFGYVDYGCGWLEWGGWGETLVGLRFENVSIPQGARVVDAHLQFGPTQYTASSEGTCRLAIVGEDIDNAPVFTGESGHLSSRRNANSTSEIVSWKKDGSWWNSNIESEKVTSIVQEIIRRDKWSSGNSLAFFLSGNCAREVQASEYDDWRMADGPPTLHITYQDTAQSVLEVEPSYVGVSGYVGVNPATRTTVVKNGGGGTLDFNVSDNQDWLSASPVSGSLSEGQQETIALSFNVSSLGEGTHEAIVTVSDPDAKGSPQQITVSLTLEAVPESSSCGDVPLYTENVVNPAVMLLLDASGSMGWNINYIPDKENARTPNLRALLQGIIDRGGWESGNSVAFVFKGQTLAVGEISDSDPKVRGAYSYEGASSDSELYPTLEIVYQLAGSETDIQISIDIGGDDVVENSENVVDADGNFLKLGANTVTGLRFNKVAIPKGASITSAYIQFIPIHSSPENASDVTVTVFAQATDSAPAFDENDNGNISHRIPPAPAPSISWNLKGWKTETNEERMVVAKAVLKELIQDRTIAWGFASWEDDYSDDDYTHFHTGCGFNDNDHYDTLISEIESVTDGSGTPLQPSMEAAQDYFAGDRKDENEDTYTDLDCQPKIAIFITDGLGNTGTTLEGVKQEARDLATEGISTVVVGFGIDDAKQIQEIAKIANEKGEESDDDSIFALHKEDSHGNGLPYLAENKWQLRKALEDILTNVKTQIFYGSTPNPTTTGNNQGVIVTAQFSADNWVGDLVANSYDSVSKVIGDELWRASNRMPVYINAYTVFSRTNFDDTVEFYVDEYTDETLNNDRYLCKPLGDIINSSPLIIGSPSYFYSFGSYSQFRAEKRARDSMVFVGSNDGALHAFRLENEVRDDGTVINNAGEELWRFYPRSTFLKLDGAENDESRDMCSLRWCHEYSVDGSPVAADVYDSIDKKWKTVLVSGLRRGGDSYFALDVTWGKSFFDAETEKQSAYMWEFSDRELGQTWAKVEIYRVGVAGEDSALAGTVEADDVTEWGVFFGSGYAMNNAAQASKEAYLYGIAMEDASYLWQDSDGSILPRLKVSAESRANNALSGVLLAEMDDNYMRDRLYAGDLYGTLYRVDDIEKGARPEVSTLLDFDRNYGGGARSHETPIRAKPSYAYHGKNEIWVHFGTGRYELQADKLTDYRQYFFGLKDDLTKPRYTMSSSAAETEGYTRPYLFETAESAVAVKDADGNTVELKRVQYIKPTDGEVQPDTGNYSWAVKMMNQSAAGAAERIISKPLVVAGLAIFTTFTPSSNVCEGSGEAWIYALDYKTGKPPKGYVVFDVNGDGKFDDNDKIRDGETLISVAGIFLGDDMVSSPVLHGRDVFIGGKKGGTKRINLNLIGLRPSLRSWWENK